VVHKDELGWADFQVRSDIAIRRHQVLGSTARSVASRPRPITTRPLRRVLFRGSNLQSRHTPGE
jgi:hypothetical protein